MSIIEQIKTEVERRIRELDEQIVDIYDSQSVLRKDELQKLLSFISDLESEKLKFKVGDKVIISNEQKGIITRISAGKARVEMGDTMRIVDLSTIESEKPMNQEGLDKEIGKIWETCEPVDEGMGVETANIHIEQFDYLARHFYDLGCRRTAEKYDEIEYNRQQAEEQVCDNLQSEYERYIASRKDGLSCYNVSVNIKDMAEHFAQWGAEHLADARKTSPNDLEEAAKKYAHCPFADDDGNFHEDAIDETAYHNFIAGAKWDREQMKETHCPRSEKWKEVEETARNEYENGWKDCKKQMMKDAVEGKVAGDGEHCWIDADVPMSWLYQDRVRVIIVKED